MALSSASGRAASIARKLGKDGQHEEAIRIYGELLQQGELSVEGRVSCGWELSHAIRDALKSAGDKDLSHAPIGKIRRFLNSYLKLGLSKPDLLHSRILQQALKLASERHLRIVPFLRIWKIENLRREDYEEFRTDDGKVFPSLAEKVIQLASKEAANGGAKDEMEYIRPILEQTMRQFPENVWLQLNMVKLLRGLGRADDARHLAIEFARSKSGEYWTWELLGDLADERRLRTSCYAKALSCSQDDNFVGKVRLKLAEMISEDHPSAAKAEVERVIEHKTRLGQHIPENAERLSHSSWFANATSSSVERSFYSCLTAEAEELLFAHLPWVDASLGDSFVIERGDNQKKRSRRRIYVAEKPLSLEITVSDTHPDIKGLSLGAPLQVRMEISPDVPGRATVHRIIPRNDGAKNDVPKEMLGVIDHINHTRKLLHFIVAKGIDGVCPLSDYPTPPMIGDTVAVRLARYHDRTGARTRLLAISRTEMAPPETLCSTFTDLVQVRNGMGFTDTGIFVPSNLITAADIMDGDQVEGTAVINFDKKRSRWGLMALTAKAVENTKNRSDASDV